MRNSFAIYSKEQLPSSFSYPESYLALSKDLSLISNIAYFPWWFKDLEEDLQEVMDIYFELTSKRNLLPFARDGDWAACFDSMDISPNPRVYVYDLGNKANHYEMASFEEWLAFVIEESKI